jgi:hypothetical protein
MPTHNAAPTDVFTVKEWCATNKLCRTTLYKLWDEGKGPRYLKAGAKILITRAADADWKQAREAETAQAAA